MWGGGGGGGFLEIFRCLVPTVASVSGLSNCLFGFLYRLFVGILVYVVACLLGIYIVWGRSRSILCRRDRYFFEISDFQRRAGSYQRGNHNPYIEEEHTIQCPK